ncbi:MAG: hypothetical protein KDA71_18275, partial [Planctomycetales bacterium]|nr:hypothetical protein [Planctomycetales bacterium]
MSIPSHFLTARRVDPVAFLLSRRVDPVAFFASQPERPALEHLETIAENASVRDDIGVRQSTCTTKVLKQRVAFLRFSRFEPLARGMKSSGVLAGHIVGLTRGEKLREDGSMHVIDDFGSIRGKLVGALTSHMNPSSSRRAGSQLFSPQFMPPIRRRPAASRCVLEIVRQVRWRTS